MVLSDDAGQSICCYLELGFHPQQHLTPDCSYRDELIARRQLRSVIQNRTKEPASETIRFDAGGWTAIRTVDLLRPQVKGPQLVFQPPQVCDSRFHLLLLLRRFLWQRRSDSLQELYSDAISGASS